MALSVQSTAGSHHTWMVESSHRPLKIRTDGSHARVCELGSISVFGFYCNFVKSGTFVTKFGTHGAADMY